jgi:hypothetical protein
VEVPDDAKMLIMLGFAAGTVRAPCEAIEIRRLTCSRAASLDGRSATESKVDMSLVVVGGDTIRRTKPRSIGTPILRRPASMPHVFDPSKLFTQPQL